MCITAFTHLHVRTCFSLFPWKLTIVKNPKMIGKFAGQYDSDFNGSWLQKVNPSGKNGLSKSAFPDFHGNRSEFQNFNPSTVLPGPDRLSVPNFVKIGRETGK